MERQQLPSPQARGQFQVEGRQQSSLFRFRKVHTDFPLRQNFHFFLFKLRQPAALCGVGEEQSLGHRLLQAVVQQRVDAPHHSGAEAFVFEFRKISALDPSAFLKIVVAPLDLNGGQLAQRDAADCGAKRIYGA